MIRAGEDLECLPMTIGRYAGLVLAGGAALALAGCVDTPPTAAPMVVAIPGKGKTYQQFQTEDGYCRQQGLQANGGRTPGQAAASSGIGSAALGTVVGAAGGALLGAAFGNAGAGAAIGAGTGLGVGAISGAGAARQSAGAYQQNYDRTYAQCMIAYGNGIQGPQPVVVAYPAPVYAYPPPPPPGPPPGYPNY